MAQHIPMDQVSVKRYRDRASKIKSKKFYHSKTSMVWDYIGDNRSVAFRDVKYGGTDCMVEVVTDDNNKVIDVYLVA